MQGFHAFDKPLLVTALALLALGSTPVRSQTAADPSQAVIAAAQEMRIDRYMRVGAPKSSRRSGQEVQVSEIRFLEKNGYKFPDLVRFCKLVEAKNAAVRVTRFDFGKRGDTTDGWWRPRSMTVTSNGKRWSMLNSLEVFTNLVDRCKQMVPRLSIDRLVADSDSVIWTMRIPRANVVLVRDWLNTHAAASQFVADYRGGDTKSLGDMVEITDSKLGIKDPSARPDGWDSLKVITEHGATVRRHSVTSGHLVAELLAPDAEALMSAIEAASDAAGSESVTLSGLAKTASGARTCTVKIPLRK